MAQITARFTVFYWDVSAMLARRFDSNFPSLNVPTLAPTKIPYSAQMPLGGGSYRRVVEVSLIVGARDVFVVICVVEWSWKTAVPTFVCLSRISFARGDTVSSLTVRKGEPNGFDTS